MWFAVGGGGITTLFLLISWLTLRYPKWEYNNTLYSVSNAGLEIRRGIIWKQVVNVPRSRIQHMDVAQGPVARRYQIATIHVFTAGTEKNVVEIGGIRYETALKIRDFLVIEENGDTSSDDEPVEALMVEGDESPPAADTPSVVDAPVTYAKPVETEPPSQSSPPPTNPATDSPHAEFGTE